MAHVAAQDQRCSFQVKMLCFIFDLVHENWISLHEKNEEEHHIDKKQKTKEHQQDADAVKAPKRRVKKLSHKDDLDPSMGVGYYLNFGISPRYYVDDHILMTRFTTSLLRRVKQKATM